MQSLGDIRSQVNEVTNIMRQNISSVLDRGEALEDIVTRANDLQATTDVFHRQTTHINRQLYWRNMKMRICVILVVLSIQKKLDKAEFRINQILYKPDSSIIFNFKG